jgi:hypothetical protein
MLECVFCVDLLTQRMRHWSQSVDLQSNCRTFFLMISCSSGVPVLLRAVEANASSRTCMRSNTPTHTAPASRDLIRFCAGVCEYQCVCVWECECLLCVMQYPQQWRMRMHIDIYSCKHVYVFIFVCVDGPHFCECWQQGGLVILACTYPLMCPTKIWWYLRIISSLSLARYLYLQRTRAWQCLHVRDEEELAA